MMKRHRLKLPAFIWLTTYFLAITIVWFMVDQRLLKTSMQISLVTIGINVILAVSLNLIIGIAGQFSLGHAGYMAIGAYATAIVMMFVDGWLGFILSILVGVVVSIIVSLIIALPTIRLKGDYLAIATLGFAEIIRIVILNTPITNGAAGLRDIPRFTSLPTLIAVIGIIIYTIMKIVGSRFGRSLNAIKDDEVAAQSLGINISQTRVLAFIIGGIFASIAGSLYASYFGYIKPDLFDFNKSIDILVIVVLGGLGSFTGSVFAAICLGVVNIFLQDFAEIRMILYALILVVTMIFKPSGLLGGKEFKISQLMKRGKKHETTKD